MWVYQKLSLEVVAQSLCSTLGAAEQGRGGGGGV